MIHDGTTLAFRPRSNERMHLPTVRPECADTGVVECADQTGAVKLWPHERLTVRRMLDAESMLCAWGRHLLLVFVADTEPADPL